MNLLALSVKNAHSLILSKTRHIFIAISNIKTLIFSKIEIDAVKMFDSFIKFLLSQF